MTKTKLITAIEELKADPPKRSGFPCRVSVILSQLSDEDGRALEDLIDNQLTVSCSAITRLLNQNGYEVKEQTIGKHRRRKDGTGCRCPKKPKA